MGAAAGGAKGGYQRRSSRRRSSFKAMSEINVTPMVDVMLVLLIIFMVAAPLMAVGVPIVLPQTKASPLQTPNEPVIVAIDASGKIYVQNKLVDLETLAAKLQETVKENVEEQIQVHGDESIRYGLFMKVVGALNGAGFSKLALMSTSELPKKSAAVQ
jgi:biopolymer transport protein TolR